METYILSPIKLNRKIENIYDRFRSVGGNPGNMVFIDAIKSHVNYKREIDIEYTEPLKNVVVVMPSSNFIRHVKNDPFFKEFQSFIEKIDGIFTLAGLGAQSSDIFNTPKKLIRYGLNDEQQAFFRTVSEKAVTIGVRGEFTAECLELMGIRNYRIIGCPSFFEMLDGTFVTLMEPSAECTQMTVTGDKRKNCKVLDFGIQNKSHWVMQSASEMSENFAGGGTVKWLYKIFPTTRFAGCLDQYTEEFSHIFWTIEEWNQFYKNYGITFAYGTRFHGNMEAFRNGVPALWITHDSRTKELTNFLGLPHISINKFRKIKYMEELIEICDYTETRRKYRSLFSNYIDFLEENQISHRFVHF